MGVAAGKACEGDGTAQERAVLFLLIEANVTILSDRMTAVPSLPGKEEGNSE